MIQRVTERGHAGSKIRSFHLERLAYVYIRQSTLQQFCINQESTQLQYALTERAQVLGWSEDRIRVIDEDIGRSGQSSENRTGFQKLLADLALEHVGIILVIEMSRLARSCKDWYHLLELCGLFGALLADADGIYDPTDYNDRLLLGLRGTMSEAELHVMQSRLWTGKLNKAHRGELVAQPPVGYVKTFSGEIVFDPDEQVCAVVRLIFEKFQELGSCHRLLDYMAKHKIKIGFRLPWRDGKGDLEWRIPKQTTLGHILHNPFYAGAYAYGRRRAEAKKRIPSLPYSGSRRVPDGEWHVLIKDIFPNYITWDQYQQNVQRLAENATRYGKRGASREGSALLNGLLVCKICNVRMNVMYSKGGHHQYHCSYHHNMHAGTRCQNFSGKVIDEITAREILRAIEPAAVELSLEAQRKIAEDRNSLDSNWKQQLERAKYAVTRAERQYHAVEPENRLVARSLEKAWEKSLLEEQNLQNSYDHFCSETPLTISIEETRKVEELATSLPMIWEAETTSPRDRKEIARHLIDAVYVNTHGKSNLADVEIHWKGGHVSHHQIEHQTRTYARMHDFEKIKTRIAELRDAGKTSKEIAEHLNQEGFHPPKHPRFNHSDIIEFVKSFGLPHVNSRALQLRPFLKADEWPLSALGRELDIPYQTIYLWHRKGWLKDRRTNERKGGWIVWADAKERKRLKDLYRLHPQNHWRFDHEEKEHP